MCSGLPTTPPTTVVNAAIAAAEGVETAAAQALRALSVIAGSGNVGRGVVKLGYSWEGLGVWKFQDLASLSHAIDCALGCTVGGAEECCFVQGWVEACLEIRFFVVEGVVKHMAYTAANTLQTDVFRVQSLTKAQAAAGCGGDDVLAAAEQLAAATIQDLLAWIARVDSSCVPVPFVRFDFLVSRPIEDGVPQIHLIEVTEPGAMLFEWHDGTTIVHAAIAKAITALATQNTND